MKQRACPVSGARGNNEQRPMECSGPRSAGGEHTWSQLCFIQSQRLRESQRTLTGVPPQSCPRRSQDVAVGRTDSAQRAVSVRPQANGVDGCRQRRRGTPFGSGRKCRFLPDFVSQPAGTSLALSGGMGASTPRVRALRTAICVARRARPCGLVWSESNACRQEHIASCNSICKKIIRRMRPALNPGPPVFQASSWVTAS